MLSDDALTRFTASFDGFTVEIRALVEQLTSIPVWGRLLIGVLLVSLSVNVATVLAVRDARNTVRAANAHAETVTGRADQTIGIARQVQQQAQSYSDVQSAHQLRCLRQFVAEQFAGVRPAPECLP